MNYTDLPRNDQSRTEWQVLGELRLNVSSNQDGTINAWLKNILSPLNLSDEVLKKIRNSAEKAVASALKPDAAEVRFGDLSLLFFAPAGLARNGSIWGFFQVERNTMDTGTQNPNSYRIEYYLYPDRKS